MAEDFTGDDEIIELAAKRLRWLKITVIGYVLVVAAGGGVAGFVAAHHGGFIVGGIVANLAEFLPLILLIFVVGPVAIWKMRPPKEYYSERITLKQADRLQYQRRRLLFLCPLIVAGMTPAMFYHTLKIANGEGHLADYLPIAGFLPLWMSYALYLTKFAFRKEMRVGVEDEMISAYRAQAIQTGFWSVLFAILAVFVLALYRPTWGIAALPCVIGFGISVAALHFAVLDRRSVPHE